jgi:hypothetical protein
LSPNCWCSSAAVEVAEGASVMLNGGTWSTTRLGQPIKTPGCSSHSRARTTFSSSHAAIRAGYRSGGEERFAVAAAEQEDKTFQVVAQLGEAVGGVADELFQGGSQAVPGASSSQPDPLLATSVPSCAANVSHLADTTGMNPSAT